MSELREWLTVLNSLTANDVVGGIFVIIMWCCCLGLITSYKPRRRR